MNDRQRALLALVKRHDIGLDEPYSGAEDISLMLDRHPDYPLNRWAIVTAANNSHDGGDYVYITTEVSLRLAMLDALINIDNDLYAETPVEIVDLDGGFVDDGVEHSRPTFKHTHVPRWRDTPWAHKIGYVD